MFDSSTNKQARFVEYWSALINNEIIAVRFQILFILPVLFQILSNFYLNFQFIRTCLINFNLWAIGYLVKQSYKTSFKIYISLNTNTM